jgi:hypothetical protein
VDQKLQELIRQLQDEQCPPVVLGRVAQRIAREKPRARSRRASLAWAVSIACLLSLVVYWHGQASRHARRLATERAAAQALAQRALVVRQTQEAFGCIAQALMRAAARTENALLKEAMPPLRNGFEIVKTKVTNTI